MHKILVVDDDADILTLIKVTLTISDYIVEGIADWQKIDNSINNFKPDLIILDVALGTADGRDICRKLKADKETEHIPIILFSANVEIEKNTEGCNAQAFIAKPYNLSGLLGTIKSVIDESRQKYHTKKNV